MRVLCATAVAGLLVAGAPWASAAPPAGTCRQVEGPRQAISELPWAQRALAPERVWPHSTGAGVLVAVVDSGVDADQPQLAGAVLPGQDFFLVGDLPGSFDCVSHGTAVASIIAARPAAGVGFRGVAPGATVLPVRVVDRDVSDEGGSVAIDPVVLARGIRYATDSGARVLNLSLSGFGDDPLIRDAIAYARTKDVVVVAAVGNRQHDTTPEPSFPAAYPGVVGVGAIDPDGNRAGSSQIGDYVDVVAPGVGVIASARAGGHAVYSGTSFAAPFVAGTVALIRSAWPALTADQVAARLLATAAPARAGTGPDYGAGIVDPYRAVTEDLSTAAPRPRTAIPFTPPPADPPMAWPTSIFAALAATTLGALAIRTITLGRRRRWLPDRTPAAPAARSDDVPEPTALFP